MIISKATENHLTKIQHPFVIKTHSKLGIKETFLKLMNVIDEKKKKPEKPQLISYLTVKDWMFSHLYQE